MEIITKVAIRLQFSFGQYFNLIPTFLVDGAAKVERPLGRKGGTPAQGWWHCLRREATPFRELYAPPHLQLRPQYEAPSASFAEVIYR